MGKIKAVCKRCHCTEWIGDSTERECKSCGYSSCLSHRWFIDCEPEDLKLIGYIEHFVGDSEEYGLPC